MRTCYVSPCAAIVCMAAMIVTTANMCRGQSYEWSNAGGGDYTNSFNWSPVGVPNAANEAATFGVNATYSVQLGADTTVGSLTVPRGVVTFDHKLPGFFGQQYHYVTDNLLIDASAGGATTLNLADADLAIGSNTVIGASGSNGQSQLALLNSDLRSGAASVGGGVNSVGRLVVDDVSTWSAAGAMVLGGAGDATLEVRADFRSSSFGSGTLYLPSQGVATHAGVVMAQSPTSDATATIHGLWTSGDLVVGDAGHATVSVLATQRSAPNGLNVSSAGKLSSGVVSTAAQPGSAGTVSVTGASFGGLSEWTIAGSLNIGGTSSAAGGVGELVIGRANTVSVGAGLKLWPGAKLNRSEVGQFTISGPANLGGALEYTLDQFTNPQLGSEFLVLSAAGGVTGSFASSVLPPLGSGLRWVINYEPTSVSLVVAAPLAADFDEDGNVDGDDLARWRTGFGTGATHVQGNADGDGDVDGADFLTWQRQLGSGVPSAVASAAVPEPAAGLLALAGVFAHVRRRGSIA